MARPLRFVPPNAVVEVTTRTIHGRLLLRPSHKLNDLVLGVLGRAQRLFGVDLHAFVALSNHMHLLVSVRDAAQLAAFMAFVNGNIAREVGRLHGWRERFWGRRYRAIVVADEIAQTGRLKYILENGVKEGLVGSPKAWPGCSSAAALTTGAKLLGTWHDRAGEYRARRRGGEIRRAEFQTIYPVTLSPLPCWRHLEAAEHRKACAELVAAIEATAAAERASGGRLPVGVTRILAANPHDLPASSDRSPAPLVHASSALVRRAFKAAYAAFVGAFRAAADALRRGERGVEFPLAAFRPPGPFVAAAPG
jgi:putative transposase